MQLHNYKKFNELRELNRSLQTFEKFSSEDTELLEEGWKTTLMGVLTALSLNFNSIAKDLDTFTINDRDMIELSDSQEMDFKKEIEKTEQMVKSLMEDFDSDSKYVAEGILDKISKLDFDTVTAGEVASINNQVVQLLKTQDADVFGNNSDEMEELLITCTNDIRNTEASVQTLIDDYHNLNAELKEISDHKELSAERSVVTAKVFGTIGSIIMLLILWSIVARKKRERKEREQSTFSFTTKNSKYDQ